MNQKLFEKLLEVLGKTEEREFDFSNFRLNDDQVEQISQKIATLPHSVKLDLSYNNLSDKAAEVLSSNPKIDVLCLECGMFGNEGAKALAASPTLKILSIGGCFRGVA